MAHLSSFLYCCISAPVVYVMAALVKKQSKREAVRSHLATLMNQGKDLLGEDGLTLSQVNGLKSNINRIVGQLHLIPLDDEISNSLKPDQIEADVLESMKILDPVELLIAELDIKVQSRNFSAPSVSVSSSTTVQCRLPKLELSTFKGNVLEWQGFWDQFKVAIHQNEGLSDIDKFKYLKRYLAGQALACISGLSLSSANYTQAIKLLEERFGNPQVLVSAHMESLLKLGKVNNMDNVKGLRKLYTDVENCVRNLRSLDMKLRLMAVCLSPF